MFGWLEKKFSKTQAEEANQFIVSLQGANGDVIDMIAGMSMFWSIFYSSKGVDLYTMEWWINEKNHSMFSYELSQHIKNLQKQGTNSSVPGLMVWLFSARALIYPELRLSGRQVWQQLARSSEEADDIAAECAVSMGLKPERIDHRKVPTGLEQLAR